jgi:hypothetical protein
MADWRYRIEVTSAATRIFSLGPLISGAWSRESDDLRREIRGEFLIDTGAYGAMIDFQVAELLSLPRRGTREIHGIHGYGTLQQFVAKVILPAKDSNGRECFFEQVIECVGVPSLSEKSRERNANVIGILGRVFLQGAHLEIDGSNGRVVLQIGKF